MLYYMIVYNTNFGYIGNFAQYLWGSIFKHDKIFAKADIGVIAIVAYVYRMYFMLIMFRLKCFLYLILMLIIKIKDWILTN